MFATVGDNPLARLNAAESFKTVEEFERSLAEVVEVMTEDEVAWIQKKLTFDIYRGVILRTPVKTGYARAGWSIGVGAPADAPDETYDTSGESTIGAGAAKLAGVTKLTPLFITNNVPYIVVLDQGLYPWSDSPRVRQSYSKQAVGGMVDLTLIDVLGGFNDEL